MAVSTRAAARRASKVALAVVSLLAMGLAGSPAHAAPRPAGPATAGFGFTPRYHYTVGAPITTGDPVIDSLGSGPIRMAIDPVSCTMLVTNYNDGSLGVVSLATRRLVRVVDFGWSQLPYAVVVDSSRRVAYVTNRNTSAVMVLSLVTWKVVRTIHVGYQPKALAVDPFSHLIYVASFDNDLPVLVIDPTTGAAVDLISIFNRPSDLALDSRTRTLYVLSEELDTLGLYDRSGPPDGDVTDDPYETERGHFGVGDDPLGVAVDSTAQRAYVTVFGEGTVQVVDGTRGLLAKIPVCAKPVGVAVDPGTHTVYVSCHDPDDYFANGTVTIIDGSRQRVTASVPVGRSPDGVVVDANTHTAYVANYSSGTVQPIAQHSYIKRASGH